MHQLGVQENYIIMEILIAHRLHLVFLQRFHLECLQHLLHLFLAIVVQVMEVQEVAVAVEASLVEAAEAGGRRWLVKK